MRYLFFFVLISALVFTACDSEDMAEKIAEKAMESGSGEDVDIDIDDENVSIKSKDGEVAYSAGKSAKMPDNFPEDVFMHDNAEIIYSASANEGFSIKYNINEKDEDAIATLKNEMEDKGWEVKSEMNMQGYLAKVFEKEKRTATVTVAQSEDKSMVSIVVGNK